MNSLSKIGLYIYLFTFVLIIVFMLFGEQIPDLFKYVFLGGLIFTFAGTIQTQRKDKVI